MPINQETLNRRLFKVLHQRFKNTASLDSAGQKTPVEDEADVFKFTFSKDGEEYGDVFVTIDDSKKLKIYYGDDVTDSPGAPTPGVGYDDSWFGFLAFLKSWAMQNQLGWDVENKDHLSGDMARRDHMKKQENIAEGYHSMGKKASYSDAVPTVKMIIQHNREIQEGEQRYRNVARIFLENSQGERILAPTTKPGVASIYARHLAEGGLPHDERWNHINGLCEEYNKMGAFVRATRNGQFNESAMGLVTEGINHYNKLRESLSKMRGHRGYNMYFESWSPSLMEDDTDTSNINELFVQETLDPRIESVMPILSKLHKTVAEMKEVDSLSEWADELVEGDGGQEALNPIGIPEGTGDHGTDRTWKMITDYEKRAKATSNDIKKQHYMKMAKELRNKLPTSDLGDGDLDEATGWYSEKHPEHDRMTKDGFDHSEHDILGKNMHRYYRPDGSLLDFRKYDHEDGKVKEGSVIDNAKKGIQRLIKGKPSVDTVLQKHHDEIMKGHGLKAWDRNIEKANRAHDVVDKARGKDVAEDEKVKENLDANQKRVGQLGPTEKVRNNNIGKLVGANENFIGMSPQAVAEGASEKYSVINYRGNPAVMYPNGKVNTAFTSSYDASQFAKKKNDELARKSGVNEGAGEKDMTGQTCEQCKKGKYQERSQQDDMDGMVTCKCGHRVKRWKKTKEKDITEGAVKELAMDLKSLSDEEFKATYKMTKAEARAGLKDKSPAKEGIEEADKHSFVGKLQRGHELKKKVDSTYKDIGAAQQKGDHPEASKAFKKHERYANLERPGTWTKVKDEGIKEGQEDLDTIRRLVGK